MKNSNLKQVSDYYSKCSLTNRSGHQAVNWNSKKSQYIRFKYLSKIFFNKKIDSLTDYGCGHAEFIKFLNKKKFFYKKYYCYDVSKIMITRCQKQKSKKNFFYKSSLLKKKTDYLVASGVFNVKLGISNKQWFKYILKTIKHFNQNTRKGFSFNALTSYSDKSKRENKKLYYCSPEKIFSFCKNLGLKVTLFHDYDLFEFTILCKKE